MASFYTYLPLLQQVEGGYTDHPNDNGNWTGGKKGVGNLVGTNYGISAPVYARWIGRVPTKTEMKNITKTEAKDIFKAWYWNEVGASQIKHQSVANIIVDHAVNAGVGSASRLTQRVLNNEFGFRLAVDGKIGPLTLRAINSVDSKRLHDAIKGARLQFYKDINQPTFIKGWTNRLKKFVFDNKGSIGLGVLTIITIIGIVYINGRGKAI